LAYPFAELPSGATLRAERPSVPLSNSRSAVSSSLYPTTSLREARDARDDARRLLSSGRDPSLVRKLDKAAKAKASGNTFSSLADELLEKKRVEGKPQRKYGPSGRGSINGRFT
jgi:hypothetical protein